MTTIIHTILIFAIIVTSIFSTATTKPSVVEEQTIASEIIPTPTETSNDQTPTSTSEPTSHPGLGYPPPVTEPTATITPTPTISPTVTDNLPPPSPTIPPEDGTNPEAFSFKVQVLAPIIAAGDSIQLQWQLSGVDLDKETESYQVLYKLPDVISSNDISLEKTEDNTYRQIIDEAIQTSEWMLSTAFQGPVQITVMLEKDQRILQSDLITVYLGASLVSSGKEQSISGLAEKVNVWMPEKALTEDALFSIHTPLAEKTPPLSLTGNPFEIIAKTSATYKDITQFNAEISIQVQYDPALLFGGNEKEVQLYYYDEASQNWFPLPTIVDTETKTLTAQSNHMTVFDYKAESWQSNTLPSVDAFKVAEFSGAGIYQYDLWVPQGAGGLQPELSLTYNSQIIDEATAFSQASWVGMGWNLETGNITRNMHGTTDDLDDDTFQINVGGISGLLLPVEKTTINNYDVITYNTADQSFLKVVFSAEDNTWKVYGKEGTLYIFSGSSSVKTSTSACATSSGNLNITWKWPLTTVRDIHQQEISYQYIKKTKPNCLNQIDVYPEKITYSNGKYQIRFITGVRKDYRSSWLDQNAEVLFSRDKLTSIQIEHLEEGNWAVQKRYQLGYAADQTSSNVIQPMLKWVGGSNASTDWARTLTLTSITEYGRDDDNLPATEFFYDTYHLIAVNNGFGGEVEFEYERWSYFDDVNKDLRTIRLNTECSTTLPPGWSRFSGPGPVRCDPSSQNMQIGEDPNVATAQYSFPEAIMKSGADYRFLVEASAINLGSGMLFGFGDTSATPPSTTYSGAFVLNNSYQAFEDTVSLPEEYNPQASVLLITCDDCRVDRVELVLFPSIYRVVTKTIRDQATSPIQEDVYSYQYDNAAPNTRVNSAAVQAAGSSTENLYHYALRQYRGNALTGMTDPTGLISLTWWSQSDALKGQPYHTLQMQQSLVEDFDAEAFNAGNWNLPVSNFDVEKIYQEDFDDGLYLYSETTQDVSITRSAYTLNNGKAMLAMLRLDERKPVFDFNLGGYPTISGTAIARLGIGASNGQYFGLEFQETGSAVGKATLLYNTGSGNQYGQELLSSGNFKFGQWYTLLIIPDEENGFLLRIWSTQDTNQVNEATLAGFGTTTWRYEEQVHSGTLWLDEYSEGLVFAETYTTYASDIQYYRDGESQGGDPYAAIADMKLKTYYDLAVTWSHPLETVERTYHTDTETLNGSSLWLGTRKSYAYDPADQNGSQFGNLTGVTAYDWDGSAWQAHSLSKTIYYPNVSAGSYLTGLPATMETYGCLNQDCSSSSLQAATRYLYDQQSNYLTSPTQGILTTQRVLLDNPGSGNQYQDTAYQYDAYGNLVRQEQFFQEGTETVLASGDAMTTETCYGAAVSAIGCAAASSGDIALPLWQQQWTSAVDVLRTEWTYDYGLGLVLSETLPNEGETYAQYDQFGRITSLIRPGDTSDSPSMRFRYYAEIPYRTEVDQMISAYQATTYRKLYDGRGNLLQTQTLNQTLEDGACDSVDGELDTCQTVVDYFHGYVSDAGQLRWQEKQTAPYVISTDPGGYLSPQPSAQQYWSSTRMDILGRTALITAADGTWQSYSYGIAWEDLLEKVAVNQYQPVANLLYRTTLSETNTINNQVQTIVSHSYQDAFGQTHLSQAALPPYTYYNYDVRGNLVQALQWDATTYQSGTPAYADAIISEISYDLGGRKTGMQDADMGNWVYEYDAPSNLLRQTDAKAQTTCLYYDLLGRLLGKNYQSNATCPGSASTYTVAYGYDAADEDNNGQGQRTSMQDLSGSTTWEFDLRGRVIHEQKTIQDPIGSLDLGTYHTWYAYHADDSLSQMVLPNQETLDYSYYTAGGLQGVSTLESDANGDHQRYHYTDQISYDEAGRLTGRTFGNGVLQTYAYYAWDNQGGRLSTVTAQNSSASSIQNLSYGNDEQGNITSLVDAVASENFAYQYDLLNRLTAVTGSLSQSTSYSNLTGNILQKDGVSYGYDPNHPHAITTLNSVSKYTYDANGSMTSRVVDGTQYNLGYDEENRLVTLSGGSLTARYVYDGDGRRVLAVVGDTRTLFVSSAFEVSITGTPPTFSDPPLENYPLCHYLYCFFMPLLLGGADSEVLGMQSGNFGNTRYHTHPLEPLATSLTWQVYYPGGGLRVQTSSSNTLTYLLTDHLNSTTTTLDTDGDITAWLRYDAWGVTRSSSGTTPTSKNYTGQYQAEAGLYFYNARWYDPETGRFAQADTIIPEAGDPLAWDRYAYVKNNPIKHCDTSGHCIDGLTTIPCLVALIAVAGFSGGSAIYQFNVSGNSWWESTEDAIATSKAGVEGMFLVVGAALTAGQVALLAPDAAMWLGANTNNTGLFSWGVNQAGLVQQTNTITNKIPNNKKVVTIQSRKNSYTNESKIPPPLEFPKAPYGFQGTYQSPYGFPVDPKSPPTPDFVWRGKGVPGSIEGNWTKPTTGEWLHWDPFHHRTSHYDYGAADGTIYRIWPDGTMSPK